MYHSESAVYVEEPRFGRRDIFVRNTFLCVRDESDDGPTQPTLRRVRSEPAGIKHRQLSPDCVRATRSVPTDFFNTGTRGFEDGARFRQWSSEEEGYDPEAGTDSESVHSSAQAAEEPAGYSPCTREAQDSVPPVRVPVPVVGVSAFPSTAVPVAFQLPTLLAQPLPHLWQLGQVALSPACAQACDGAAKAPPEGESLSCGARPQVALQVQAAPQRNLATGGDRAHVYWTVNARKIQSKETKVASPRFCVFLPTGPCPFQLMLYAEARSPRWGSSGFARARGRGRIELRCGAELPSGAGKITFSLNLGDQPARPPVSHDFSQQSCCGLRRWDFGSAVDASTGTFVVHLEIKALGPFESIALGGASCGAVAAQQKQASHPMQG